MKKAFRFDGFDVNDYNSKRGKQSHATETEVHAQQKNSIDPYKLLQERAPQCGSGSTIQKQRVLAILNSTSYVEAEGGQGRPSRFKICTREVGGLDTQTSGLDLDTGLSNLGSIC